MRQLISIRQVSNQGKVAFRYHRDRRSAVTAGQQTSIGEPSNQSRKSDSIKKERKINGRNGSDDHREGEERQEMVHEIYRGEAHSWFGGTI
jgi:hypothetical protein